MPDSVVPVCCCFEFSGVDTRSRVTESRVRHFLKMRSEVIALELGGLGDVGPDVSRGCWTAIDSGDTDDAHQ